VANVERVERVAITNKTRIRMVGLLSPLLQKQLVLVRFRIKQKGRPLRLLHSKVEKSLSR
jgi:hypothetical protein